MILSKCSLQKIILFLALYICPVSSDLQAYLHEQIHAVRDSLREIFSPTAVQMK